MKTLSMTFVAAALLAACGGGKTPAIKNSAGGGGGAMEQPSAAGPGFKDGALWTCQISDYDPQPCKLSRADGGWQLVKLLGSQRFAGSLAPRPDALAFDGQFFCPWGACDAEMKVEFTLAGDGTLYTTDFEGDSISLRYDEALESEWGGAGYGGLTGREQ